MKEALARLKKSKPALLLSALAALCALMALLGRGGDAGSLEDRAAAALSSVAGAGRVRVVIYSSSPASAFSSGGETPLGAVIVAQGAKDLRVRLELRAAAQALLGLPAQRVEVLRMEESP